MKSAEKPCLFYCFSPFFYGLRLNIIYTRHICPCGLPVTSIKHGQATDLALIFKNSVRFTDFTIKISLGKEGKEKEKREKEKKKKKKRKKKEDFHVRLDAEID